MKQIIFCNVPAQGHVNPTIALVKELTQKGHRVHYFGDADFQDKFNFPGVDYHWVDFTLLEEMLTHTLDRPLEMLPTAIETSRDFLRAHLAEFRRIDPDLIIYDNTCLWAKDAAYLLGKPSIASFTIFALEPKILNKFKDLPMFSIKNQVLSHGLVKQIQSILKFKKLFTAYRKEFRLPKQKMLTMFTNSSPLNLVFTLKKIQPHPKLLKSDYRFIGPALRPGDSEEPEWFSLLMPDAPTVYVSLGTAKNNNKPFFELCIRTLKKHGYNGIISCGRHFSQADFGPVPENIIIQNTVPQLAVLKKADVFITHCGMNSGHEGLYYGVPMLFAPQQDEQYLVASQLESLGTGILLNEKTLTIEGLSESIREVLTNPQYIQGAQRLSLDLQEAGGAKEGAEIVNTFLEEKE